MSGAFEIARLDVYALEAKIETPVTTSFGSIPARVSALLRIEDTDGHAGWGEIWGNFPSITCAYRAALACKVLPEPLLGAAVETPGAFCIQLANKLRVLAVQAAEPGPISAVLAATNQALWDLAARRQALPLRRALNEDAGETVPVYASGLNPTDSVEVAVRAREAGYRAFKLKIGFGDDVDRRNLHGLRLTMKEGEQLFVDANQRWSLGEALGQITMLEAMDVDWWEEPMLAEAPASDWRVLRDSTLLPLAGGENLRDMGRVPHRILLPCVRAAQPRQVGRDRRMPRHRAERAQAQLYLLPPLAVGRSRAHALRAPARGGGRGRSAGGGRESESAAQPHRRPRDRNLRRQAPHGRRPRHRHRVTHRRPVRVRHDARVIHEIVPGATRLVRGVGEDHEDASWSGHAGWGEHRSSENRRLACRRMSFPGGSGART